jgi:hypothetical protein
MEDTIDSRRSAPWASQHILPLAHQSGLPLTECANEYMLVGLTALSSIPKPFYTI